MFHLKSRERKTKYNNLIKKMEQRGKGKNTTFKTVEELEDVRTDLIRTELGNLLNEIKSEPELVIDEEIKIEEPLKPEEISSLHPQNHIGSGNPAKKLIQRLRNSNI